MTVWHQPKLHRLIVHLVNYDREEGTPGQERPRLTGSIQVNLNLPSGERVLDVEFATPEEPEPKALTWNSKSGGVQFTTPSLLVYGVATVKYAL
jgi:hypothetical protein